MKKFSLQQMVKGWFIGDIDPAAFRTKDCEVAVKHYKEGDAEGKHYHKVATEITVIIKGKVRMGGIDYSEGNIIIVEPGEAVDFYCYTDTITTVVKLPGALNDKYLIE